MTKLKVKQEFLDDKYLNDLHHDLKNQIASIKAFNQLIIRKTENDDVKDYSRSIEDRTETLLELINDFFQRLKAK